ncbi:MAG TPA: hypothetical protein VFU55_01695 [Terracidiphilus sp.]|nr:hypothetical protein [Terracidiphilus sp.]
MKGHDFSRAESQQTSDPSMPTPAQPLKAGLVTGHDFSRAENDADNKGALATAAEGEALKGHDFSRAINAAKRARL